MTPVHTLSPDRRPADLGALLVGALRELAQARTEADTWREMAHAAVDGWHALRREHDRQTTRYHALLDERRAERQAPRRAA